MALESPQQLASGGLPHVDRAAFQVGGYGNMPVRTEGDRFDGAVMRQRFGGRRFGRQIPQSGGPIGAAGQGMAIVRTERDGLDKASVWQDGTRLGSGHVPEP